MGNLTRRLDTGSILIRPQTSSKEQVISLLCKRLQENGLILDQQQLFSDIMEREKLASTSLGLGIAIPHAHSSTIKTTILAAAVIDPPLEGPTPDDIPVNLVFLMAGPPGKEALHIRLLSKLARLLHDRELREALIASADQEEFFELLDSRDS